MLISLINWERIAYKVLKTTSSTFDIISFTLDYALLHKEAC